jgi:predicted dehydrogenase
MPPIRVAFVRCDTHAYWYGPFMFACDPLKLQVNNVVCHHFFTSMYNAKKWEIPRLGGLTVAKVYDANRKAAETLADTFTDHPEVCDRIEDAAEGVDAAFINNCDLDAADHLKLAAPFLKKGIPTFVDKPFASNWKDAKAIVELARKHKAPLMSCSLLMFTDEVPNMLKRRDEVGPLRFGVVKGVNGWATKSGLEGIIHGVSMGLATFGYDIDWVECMGELPLEFITMHYPDGRKMLVMSPDGSFYGGKFVVEVWGQRSTSNTPVRTNLQSEGTGDAEFLTAGPKVVKLFKKMVQTRQPPIPYERILTWMRVVEAARRAQKTGKRVWMKSIT